MPELHCVETESRNYDGNGKDVTNQNHNWMKNKKDIAAHAAHFLVQ